MRRIDFLGNQLQAITDYLISQGANAVPQEKRGPGRPPKNKTED